MFVRGDPSPFWTGLPVCYLHTWMGGRLIEIKDYVVLPNGQDEEDQMYTSPKTFRPDCLYALVTVPASEHVTGTTHFTCSSLTRRVDSTMIFYACFSWTLTGRDQFRFRTVEHMPLGKKKDKRGKKIDHITLLRIWTYTCAHSWPSIHFLVSFVLVAPPFHPFPSSIPSALCQSARLLAFICYPDKTHRPEPRTPNSQLSVTFFLVCVYLQLD
jgi:hypothetical protein